VSPALLEKQLLAVQHSLREEIAEEKRKVGQLLSRLRELNGGVGAPPSPASAPRNGFHHQPSASVSSSVSGYSVEGAERQCEVEEKRKEELLAEVIHLRHLCAQLRARLEQESVALKTAMMMQQPSTATNNTSNNNAGEGHGVEGELLITRF